MFRFKYDTFYQRYQDAIQTDSLAFPEMNEMEAFMYDLLEKDTDKFCVTHVSNVKRFRDMGVNPDVYPYGIFVIPDYVNLKAEKWLMFVFPVDYGDKYMANHYTFVKNKNKICGFHLTQYDVRDDEDTHKFGDFKDNIDLPLEGCENLGILETFRKRGWIKYIPSIMDIIRYPWTILNSRKHRGGGKSSVSGLTTSTRSAKRSREENDTVSRKIISDSQLHREFEKYNLETLMVFAFLKDGIRHYSCHFYDSHQQTDRDKTQKRPTIWFEKAFRSSHDERSIRASIKRSFVNIHKQ